MEKKTIKYVQNISFVVISAILMFGLLLIIVPKAQPILSTRHKEDQEKNAENKMMVHYTALGDSLTEGIGDTTNSGGFVSLVARDLEKEYNLNGIAVTNFGVAGDRSDQILSRIKKNRETQQGIEIADFITLTVGGNDLMQVIKGDIFNLTTKSFDRPQQKYQKQLQNLLAEIRKYNDHAPIYILGIYNPYYLYFPDITEMQEIVDNWNKATQEVIKKDDKVYFVPINDLLSKGSKKTLETDVIKNDLLFEDDVFHPNNLGYRLVADAIRDKMIDTSNLWLPKRKE